MHLKGSKTALVCLGQDGREEALTFGDLTAKSNSFAHVLGQLGVKPQDTVFSLLGRIPELYIVAIGTLKFEAIFCPLFSAFGPDPVKTRMRLGQARVLITTGRKSLANLSLL
jgi:acetyl-CoA synthetase